MGGKEGREGGLLGILRGYLDVENGAWVFSDAFVMEQFGECEVLRRMFS